VERLRYNGALLDVSWRATRRGLLFRRVRITRLRSSGGTIRVEIPCRGGRGCEFGRSEHKVETSRRSARLRPMERRFAPGAQIQIEVNPTGNGFWKIFVLTIRRYRDYRRVRSPFSARAHCNVPGEVTELTSERCDRVFGRR
jgi:hypothetical protein